MRMVQLKSRRLAPSKPLGMLMILLSGTFSLTAGNAAGQATDGPSRYAIENARIVTVTGNPIERGTIIIENGTITADGRPVDLMNKHRELYERYRASIQ